MYALLTFQIQWFFDILYDGLDGNPDEFPEAVAKEEPSTRPQTLTDFKKQLLFFWTGNRTFNSELNYQVMPVTGTLFKAHVCYSQLEMPTRGPGAETKQAMYEMLVRTVGLEGFGFAGGKLGRKK